MARMTLARPRAPLFPDHPLEEHQLRVDRARELMEIEGLDAVIFARNVNVYYMTGSRFVFVGFDQPMALAPQTTAILTRDADIYCQRFGPFDSDDVSIDTTLSESFEHYDSELELPSILSDYGIGAGARVGIEWGRGMCTGINPVLFMDLQDKLENQLGVELVDSNPLVRTLMAIKSPLEIERMSRAVGAAARAMNRLYERIELGMQAREVARIVSGLMLEEGAQNTGHAQVMSEGAGANELKSCDPVDQPLETGWVHLDFGCKVGRYASDINRGLFLGRAPTAREEEIYAVRRGVNDLLDTLIKPGVSIESVVSATQGYVEDNGLEFSIIGGFPFTGHSIGMENYVGPNLVPDAGQPRLVGAGDGEPLLFQEGMMFTFECTTTPPNGEKSPFFNTEDNVVVTADGVRNMSSEVSRDLVVKA
jgi:Xaa-Pro aminopeptidase